MHSFLIVTLSFASMCSYLSWATHQPAEQSMTLAGFTKVIREQVDSTQAKLVLFTDKPETAPAVIATQLPFNEPLDLSVPLINTQSETLSFETNSNSWFEENQDQKVQYDAELLFDSKEGNTIRGGQLKITIPMG
jgi:hypothetical protein